MNVFVTGATGFIGQHLVRRLLAENHTVHCLARPTSIRPAEFAERVEWVNGDLSKPESLIAGMQGCEVIFHLAGEIKGRDAAEYITVNAHGTANLVQAAISLGSVKPHFIYVSSLAAAGPASRWKLRTEDEPACPVSAYGQSKLQGEIAVLRHRQQLRCTIVRPAVVFGSGDRASLIFFKLAKAHLNPHLGLTENRLSLIHVEDLVQLLMLIASSNLPSGEIFYACDDAPAGYSWNEIIAQVGQALECRLFPIYLPRLSLPFMAGILRLINRFKSQKSIANPDKLRELAHPYWTCAGRKARELLNFSPAADLTSRIAQTAAWYREHKWI